MSVMHSVHVIDEMQHICSHFLCFFPSFQLDDRRDNRGYGFDRRGGDDREDDFDRSQMRSSSDRDRYGGDRDRDRYGGDRDRDRYGGDRDRYGDRDRDRYGDRGGYGRDRYGDRGGGYDRRGGGYDRDRRSPDERGMAICSIFLYLFRIE